MSARLCIGCLLLGACTFNTSGLPSRDAPRADRPALDGPTDLSDGPRGDGPIADRVLTEVRLDRALSDADQPKPDATTDQPHGDQPKPDTSPPDISPPPDQPKPDAAQPDAAQPDTSPPSCLALFQNKGIPGFIFCSETPTTCVFFYDPASTDNCGNMCAKGGRGCIKSAEDSSNGCDTYADQDCAFNHGDGVCHCNR